MGKPFVYIVYDRRTYSEGLFKTKYHTKTWITSVGVFSGNVNDLLDHYSFSPVATFDCLIPEEEMEAYLKDLRLNHEYEYRKLIDMLIDMNCTGKYRGYTEYLLNQYCLSKSK